MAKRRMLEAKRREVVVRTNSRSRRRKRGSRRAARATKRGNLPAGNKGSLTLQKRANPGDKRNEQSVHQKSLQLTVYRREFRRKEKKFGGVGA